MRNPYGKIQSKKRKKMKRKVKEREAQMWLVYSVYFHCNGKNNTQKHSFFCNFFQNIIQKYLHGLKKV